MEDNLDNELKDRIREVFDNYDDAFADTGWQLLREKFPEKKKRRIVPLWWYSAAAVLLLALGLWFFYPQNKGQQQVVSHPAKATDHLPVQQPASALPGQDTSAGYQDRITTIKPQKQVGNPDTPGAAANVGASQQEIAHVKIHASKPGEITAQQQLAAQKPDNVAAKNSAHRNLKTPVRQNSAAIASVNLQHVRGQQGSSGNPPEKLNQNNNLHPDELPVEKPTGQELIAGNTSNKGNGLQVDSENTTVPGNIARQEPQKAPMTEKERTTALMRIMADDKNKQLTADKTRTTETIKKNKSVALSVYAATYFNYAKGSTSDLNVGAGFSSDFRVNNNIKLSTGISIAQNTLRYENSNDVPAQINSKVADAANHANTFAFSSASLVSSAAPAPSVKSSNANLVGLDIPINIKYEFNPKKSEAYIMAGISSGTYINETYRSSYSYTSGVNNYYAAGSSALLSQLANDSQPTLESTTKQHFNSFDFAKTLNVSFGVGYPLGKYTLIVEPFLKYPLSGLGSQDIRFGAGGVNLKFNFRSIKK